MSTKVIYPILIIIFSILIIFAIINNKNNNKLNIGVENFINSYLEKHKKDLISNIETNTENTKNIANGNWTYYGTSVDSNKNVSNLININIIDITNNNNNNDNYGTVIIGNDTYNINMILNQNLTAILSNNSSKSIHIRFYNIYGIESNINLNNKFSNSETYQSEISMFNNDKLINKFISYKVFNNYANDELFRIIKENNYYINKPPPLYDFIPYNVITGGSYKFPPNFISFGNEKTNIDPTTVNTIKNKYFGQIQFSIIRVFYSPYGNEIRTQSSNPLLLNISTLQNNQLPTQLKIVPFSEDQRFNNLNSFFKPKATLLYFYKAIKIDTTYSYADPNYQNVTTQDSTLNLNNENRSLNNQYQPTIQYNNLATIKKVNNNIFEKRYFDIKDSNLNDYTIFEFSRNLNKL